MQNTDSLLFLAKQFFPKEIFNYFSLSDVKEENSALHFFLEEDNNIPEAYASLSLESNGFYPEVSIKDFPLRDKEVILHVKRRRWVDRKTGKSYSRQYDLTAKGTRYSKEFAAFLKEVFGYFPDNL